MDKQPNPYAGHRCPTEIISHAVWLYLGFGEQWNRKPA
jgi:hypothetical protein